MKFLYTILFLFFLSVPAQAKVICGEPSEMIRKAIQEHGMAFTATGIIRDGHVMQLYTRSDGLFYFLIIDNEYTEACVVLSGIEFFTHNVKPT